MVRALSRRLDIGMSSISGLSGAINWLNSALAYSQATSGSSSSTGIAILDALNGSSSSSSKLSDGLGIADGLNLATTFATIQQNFVSQQNTLAGQAALNRITSAAQAKQSAISGIKAAIGGSVNKTA
jgi:hypothetical protein